MNTALIFSYNTDYAEWTQALTKYLREQLQKILEYYQGSGGGSAVAAAQSGFLTAAPTTVIDLDGATRQWNYGTQLAQHMYSEGLLDRHEFLSWIIELLEKVKITDDTVLKLVMALVLKVGYLVRLFQVNRQLFNNSYLVL
jgi:mediator of RNA polymerase II transcription subunit 12